MVLIFNYTGTLWASEPRASTRR